MGTQTHTIGENIERFRKMRGMSRAALSRAAGYNVTFVRDIVHQRIKSPTHDALVSIANALDVPVAALYTPKDQFDWAGEINGLMVDFTASERAAVAAFVQVLKQQRD